MGTIKKGSMKHRLCKIFLVQKKSKKNGGFLSWEQIYTKLGAKTKIAKAHLRGIVNLDRKKHGDNSMFKRHKEHKGSYRITVNEIKVA